MRVTLITVGDELCRGEILNTNAQYLASELWDLQLTVTRIVTCGDKPREMEQEIRRAALGSDLVIVSGGLGPTMDDCTVDVMTSLVGVPAVPHEESARVLNERFAMLGRPVSEHVLRQVRFLRGAIAYGNPVGLAPGFEAEVEGTPVVCLPGPPSELEGIFTTHLRQRFSALRRQRGERMEHICRRIYKVFGKGESHVEGLLRGLDLGEFGSLHFQVSFPEVFVKLVVRHTDKELAKELFEGLDGQIRTRLGSLLYGVDDETFVGVLATELLWRRQTVATAESCTGGLIGAELTSVAGSSAYYIGGAVTYSNEEKVRQLGVSPETLDRWGAVSEEVVLEMAAGIRMKTGADWGIAVSGIAGPQGGTEDKPVGTVWIAVAGAGSCTARHHVWPGTRARVRSLAVYWALGLLRHELNEVEKPT